VIYFNFTIEEAERMDEFKTFIPKEALLTQRIKNFKYQALTDKIIAAAIEVHRALGPGLLESTYEACLAK
jgi:hypothetical protein